MEIGKFINSGVTAEVYEWGKDKILKLFFDKFNIDEWVDYEYKIGNIIHESGIISPAIYDIVEIDGRKGIIYQRIPGKTIVDRLVTEPWKFYDYIQKTAKLQHYIHKFSTSGLPTQKDRFTAAIRVSSYILGIKAKKIIEYTESLPDGESICHGDFYFNNIIVSNKKLVPIDWNSAYIGNPMSDVARTCMIICLPGTPFEISEAAAMFSNYPKWLAFKVYLDEYMKLSNSRFEYKDIDAWVLPAAAVRLKDNVPGEKKWLLKIINERLEKLN